jgi:hypothetical protein
MGYVIPQMHGECGIQVIVLKVRSELPFGVEFFMKEVFHGFVVEFEGVEHMPSGDRYIAVTHSEIDKDIKAYYRTILHII